MNRKLPVIVVAVLMIMASSIACSVTNKKPSGESLSALSEIENSLFGLNYPVQKDLTECFTEDRCKALYLRTMQSLDTLFASGRDQALSDTLWSINEYCPQLDVKADSKCSAAVSLLYFFDTKPEDERLFQFVRKVSKKALQSLFGSHLAWIGNRPDTKKWISYIDSHDGIDQRMKGHLHDTVAEPIKNSKVEIIRFQYEDWKRRKSRN